MSSLNGFFNGSIIAITITNSLNMPVVSFETLKNIFSERDGSVTINGNMVVIIESNEFTKLQVTSKRTSFRSYAFLKTTITENGISIIVKDLETRLVVSSSELSFSSS